MLWLALVVMAFAAAAILAAPLLRRSAAATPRAAFARAAYRDQLDEIARDRDRGLLSATEAEAARAEIARRILATEDAPAAAAAAAAAGSGARARELAVVLALVVPAVAGLLYLERGAPDVVARLETDARARAAAA
ncbi:MAG: c-type cytochrome biogenesis protein CcmI, partial [Alphaproteobacteria bacterium]|nr:c-type cytochrome biogenesis protein CcmI [Alphaproteobacteria bacterium]